MSKLPYEVETRYVARIDYEIDDDFSKPSTKHERIEAYASACIEGKENIEVEFTGGGPCWDAYLIFTGDDKEKVSKAAHATYLYIKKFKGAKFHGDY